MPIYEYCCSSCDHVFEEWTQHHDSPDSMTCPKCGGKAERIVSNTSFMLKGKGWYVTEYGTHRGKSEGGPAAAPDEHHDGNVTAPKDTTAPAASAASASSETKAEKPKTAAPEKKAGAGTAKTATSEKSGSAA